MDNMTDEQILMELREVLADVLSLDDPTVITVESRYIEDLQVDSIDMLSVLLEVQNKYGIEIPTNEVETVATVGQTIAYIQRKIQTNGCPCVTGPEAERLGDLTADTPA